MHRGPRRTALIVFACALLPLALYLPIAASTTPFATEIARLSEPEGYFDTDNLISNETSYLDAIPALVVRGVRGGAYIGVGPDQNFSYIARIRPEIAYIIDIRRDNLLLHLLFKALFARAGSRVEYLSLLTGRAPPGDRAKWTDATVDEIVAHVDKRDPDADAVAWLRSRLDETIASFGVPLTRADFDTIDRFHRAFISAGLALRFHSHGRVPYPAYPTFRQLLLATDASGRHGNYLAREDDFQFLKALQGRDAVIPVVGDVSGSHALRAVGTAVAQQRLRVSAFYLSNVEFYLRRAGTADRLAANLRQLPHDPQSVIIRSVFGGGSSVSTVQPLDESAGQTMGPFPFSRRPEERR